MYRSHTTKNTCTEIDLICTEDVMYRNCPPLVPKLSCTESNLTLSYPRLECSLLAGMRMHCNNLRLVLGLGLVTVSSRVRVRIKVKVRVSVMVRVSIRTSWVVMRWLAILGSSCVFIFAVFNSRFFRCF